MATGYDRILYLVALLLVGGGFGALVGIVAPPSPSQHSITLALAALEQVIRVYPAGWWSLRSRSRSRGRLSRITSWTTTRDGRVAPLCSD